MPKRNFNKVPLRTKWLWIRIPLLSLKLQINIIKMIMNTAKKARERYQSLSKEEKKMTIWS